MRFYTFLLRNDRTRDAWMLAEPIVHRGVCESNRDADMRAGWECGPIISFNAPRPKGQRKAAR